MVRSVFTILPNVRIPTLHAFFPTLITKITTLASKIQHYLKIFQHYITLIVRVRYRLSKERGYQKVRFHGFSGQPLQFNFDVVEDNLKDEENQCLSRFSSFINLYPNFMTCVICGASCVSSNPFAL